MKTNVPMNTAQGYHDPELEKQIEQEAGSIRHAAMLDARHLAETNLPSPEETDHTLFTGNIITGFQELSATAEKRIQASFNQIQGTIVNKNWEEEDKAIAKQIEDTEHELRLKKREKAGHKPLFDMDKLARNKMGIMASAAMEALLSRSAFLLLGENLIVSYLISALMGYGLYKSTFMIAQLIRNAPTKVERRVRIFLLTAITILFFYGIASLRLLSLERSGTISTELLLSPIYFVITNLFLYGTACYMAMNTQPSEEDEALQKKYQAKEAEIKTLEEKKANLIRQRTTQKSQKNEKLLYCASRMEYEKYIRNKINALCRQTLFLFISENLKYRKDRLVPVCYRNAIPLYTNAAETK